MAGISEEERRQDDEENVSLVGFIPRLRDELQLLAQREGYSDLAKAFAHWTIRQVSARLSDRTIRSSVVQVHGGTSSRAVWLDPNSIDYRTKLQGCLLVGNFRWSDNAAPTGKELQAQARELVDLARAVKEGPSASLYPAQCASSVESARRGGLPLRAIMAVDAPIPEEGRSTLEEMIHDATEGLRDDLRIEVLDLGQLYDLYLLRLDSYDLQIPERVDLRSVGPVAAVLGVPGRAITMQVPLSEIYALVRDHQLALFAKNLRVPISGARYNRKIQEVLGDADQRPNFWYFNNGITATCHAFEVTPGTSDGPATISATHLQIVNGCQTSMTIYNEGARLQRETSSVRPLQDASVLLRLIELPADDAGRSALGQRIARFTNSQTPITGRDLHATDPQQAKFREDLSRDWRIFFETKKQEWRRRVEQNDSFKQNFAWPYVIQNDQAGQLFVAFWLHRPAFAKSYKRDVFEDEELYQAIFGLQTSSESLLIPVFFSLLLEDWRKARGFVKRHRGPGSAHRVSKDKVVTHGEFYLLSMLGASVQRAFECSETGLPDVLELKRMARNLRLINQEYGGPFQGTLRRLARSLEVGCDDALGILHEYSTKACEADPDLEIRTLLVRDSTWPDITTKYSRRIDQLLAPAKLLLTNEYA